MKKNLRKKLFKLEIKFLLINLFLTLFISFLIISIFPEAINYIIEEDNLVEEITSKIFLISASIFISNLIKSRRYLVFNLIGLFLTLFAFSDETDYLLPRVTRLIDIFYFHIQDNPSFLILYIIISLLIYYYFRKKRLIARYLKKEIRNLIYPTFMYTFLIFSISKLLDFQTELGFIKKNTILIFEEILELNVSLSFLLISILFFKLPKSKKVNDV